MSDLGTQDADLSAAPPASFSRLARSSASIFASNLLLLVCGFAQTIIVARMLGPEGKGLVFLFLLTLTTVAQILNLSIGSSLQHHLGRGTLTPPAAIGIGVGLACVMGGAAALALLLFRPQLSSLLGLPALPFWIFSLSLTLLPVTMLSETLFSLMIALEQIGPRNTLHLVRGPLALSLAAGLVGLGGLGVAGAILVEVLASLVILALALGISTSRWGCRLSVGGAALRQALGYGLCLHGSSLAKILKRVDSFIVYHFLGGAAVGLYSVANALADLPLILPRSMHGVALSAASRNGAAGDAATGVAKLSRATSPLLLAGLAVYAAASYLLIPRVYGPAFAGAFAPFLVLTLSTFCLSIHLILSGYLTGSSRALGLTAIMAAGVLANLALSLALTPRYGLVGNAAATALGGAAILALTLRLFSRHTGLPASNALVPRPDDIGRLKDWIRRRQRAHVET